MPPSASSSPPPPPPPPAPSASSEIIAPAPAAYEELPTDSSPVKEFHAHPPPPDPPGEDADDFYPGTRRVPVAALPSVVQQLSGASIRLVLTECEAMVVLSRYRWNIDEETRTRAHQNPAAHRLSLSLS